MTERITHKRIEQKKNELYQKAVDNFLTEKRFDVFEWLTNEEGQDLDFLNWYLGDNQTFFEEVKEDMGFGHSDDYNYYGDDETRYGESLTKEEEKRLTKEIKRRSKERLTEILKKPYSLQENGD